MSTLFSLAASFNPDIFSALSGVTSFRSNHDIFFAGNFRQYFIAGLIVVYNLDRLCFLLTPCIYISRFFFLTRSLHIL